MASSNRHWPSLFKSKPCNPCNAHHQWQHDINTASLLSTPCQKPPFASPGGGTEERTPEPKPRWNPKPEQIRILEAIFNSGMVNPPRDEIRRIRVQLQEYGQVGDANVFYWFQNRKSRSKHKQRQLQSRQQQQQQPRPAPNVISVTTASSSSSSSDPSNSSGCSDKTLTSLSSKTTSITGTAGGGMMELSNNSPTASVNQTFFTPGELPFDQFFFHAHAHAQAQAHAQAHAQGYNCNISPVDLSLSSLVATEPQASLGLRSGFWSELMMNQPQPAESGCKNISTVVDGDHHHLVVMDETKGKMQQQFHSNNIYSSPAPIATASTTAPIITAASVPEPPPSPTPALPQGPQGPQCSQPPPSPPPAVTATTTTATGATKDASLLSAPISEMLQGIGVPTMVVFINEEAYEVGVGPLNVKLAFGLDAVLFHSSGLPVLVDDWGVTLHPLQNGASYYVV